MKRFLSLFLVVIMVLTCFASCKKYDEEPQVPPTDEELIAERIDTFLTAYNSGDMEGVLGCLDAKTRNAFQAMMNLLGGIAGAGAGFNIDLSDLFSLGVSMTSDDFMKLEITEINVIDSSSAIATTVMDLTGSGTQTIYFEMVYENDGWYIHDMTDRAPSGTTNDQESENNGDSNYDNYDMITCEPFVDGRAWVKYSEHNKKIYYYGFIDTQGNILYSIPADGVQIINIGKGSGVVSSANGLALIDENGEVKMELTGSAEINAYGDGYAWIYQNKSTITSLEHLYGVVNYKGEWIEPMKNLQEKGLYDDINYIGDGFVGENGWRNSVVYHVWNAGKSVQITLNGIYSNRSIAFHNGMAFVSCSIHRADTVIITITTNRGGVENTQTYEVNKDCIIYEDGRLVQLNESYTNFYNGKVITRQFVGEYEGYYQIIDYTKVTPVTSYFTTYPASAIKGFMFNGDYGLVEVRGLDEETYVTMIDVQGNELITPIKGVNLDNFVLAPHGYAYYKQNNVYHIVDKNNNITETDIDWSVSFDGSGEIGRIRDYFNGISYIKPNGEKLFENLQIK